MAESSKFMTYAMVVIVSLIMVALGANELERRFVHSGPRKNTNMRALVEDLQGDTNEYRASMSGKVVAPQRSRNNDHVEEEDKEHLRDLLNKIAP